MRFRLFYAFVFKKQYVLLFIYLYIYKFIQLFKKYLFEDRLNFV